MWRPLDGCGRRDTERIRGTQGTRGTLHIPRHSVAATNLSHDMSRRSVLKSIIFNPLAMDPRLHFPSQGKPCLPNKLESLLLRTTRETPGLIAPYWSGWTAQ